MMVAVLMPTHVVVGLSWSAIWLAILLITSSVMATWAIGNLVVRRLGRAALTAIGLALLVIVPTFYIDCNWICCSFWCWP